MFMRIFSSLILLLISSSTLATSHYGYYSNVDKVEGELSGIEILLLNDGRGGQCDQSILLQRFEGWPQYPELIDCCQCSASEIQFTSPTLGRFVGKIENNSLQGEFVPSRYEVKLPKGQSIWQSDR